MNYEEGTVGYLIEQLNKIKDKNKKVYWVETQYDEYDCYGDGFTTTFHLIDGFGAGGFSLETPMKKTFRIEYRLFTAEETQNLEPLRFME